MRQLRVFWAIVTALALLSLVPVAGCGEAVTTESGLESTSAGSSATAAAGASTTSEGASALTRQQVISLTAAAGLLSPPEQIQVFGWATFGDWGSAYAWAPGHDSYLVVFRDQGSGWAIVDNISGLSWEDTQARLRSEGAPEELIDWAYPEGD
jgi:hypothetical protein